MNQLKASIEEALDNGQLTQAKVMIENYAKEYPADLYWRITKPNW